MHGQYFLELIQHTSDVLCRDAGSRFLKNHELLHDGGSIVICSPGIRGAELPLDLLDILGLIVAAETRISMANCGVNKWMEGFRGRIESLSSANLSCKIRSYSLVPGTLTIMWM